MSDELKSAYELAMERLRARDEEQAGAAPLTPEQKSRVAQVRTAFRARRAELEILHRSARATAAGDPEKLQRLEGDYRQERARLDEDEAAEVEKIRVG